MILSDEDIDTLINNKPFTLGSCRTQQEEETMTDNLKTDLNTPTFKPVPVAPLTDEELDRLLATKSVDGEAVYITDADETADEPTIH